MARIWIRCQALQEREMLADAIEGAPRSTVLRNQRGGYAGAIARIIGGSWRGKARNVIRVSGYVAYPVEASLWSIGRRGDYRVPCSPLPANLGEDADTTAAITGQLVGALYGMSGICDRDQSSFSSDPGSAIEGFGQKIPLDDESADLGVQLRHFDLPAERVN